MAFVELNNFHQIVECSAFEVSINNYVYVIYISMSVLYERRFQTTNEIS